MRKSTISGFGARSGVSGAVSWLDLEKIAIAEVSSEDPQHPFEQILRTDTVDRMESFRSGATVDTALL
jgi:hypothetical protein